MKRLTIPFSAFALAALTLPNPALADEPTQTALFTAREEGYHSYRIPSLLVTAKGAVLAFCEARKAGLGDAGDIDLVMKRSTDGGKTWSKMQVVWDDAKNTCGNPCPVVDSASGTIFLLLTHNLGKDVESAIVAGKSKGSRTVWITRSTDDGLTWEKPVEITRTVKKQQWTWYATGPGVGIQLKNGRLLVPCDSMSEKGKLKEAHVILSDDHGKTWKLGGIAGPDCNESQAVQLADGSVLLNMRSYRGKNRRLVARSRDGGETFSRPVPDEGLIEPVCQASIIRLPGKDGGILFSNPASKKRERMTIRLSRDEGGTWPVSRVLHAGPAAYSCLAALPGGGIGCLYERGNKHAYETITFARIHRGWLLGK